MGPKVNETANQRRDSIRNESESRREGISPAIFDRPQELHVPLRTSNGACEKIQAASSPLLTRSRQEKDENKEDKKKQKERERELETTANEIKQFLKLHYMRKREADKVAAWLYGKNIESKRSRILSYLPTSELISQLYLLDIENMFDYFEIDPDNPEISAADFDEIFGHFRFDPVLKSVHFRNFRVKGKEAVRFKKPVSHLDDDMGRTDMKFFFNWFKYKKGVERILKVIVEDTEDSHSDEAIEESLKDLMVEILDWRKEDLCQTTIRKIGDNLTAIYLQWNGKNEVLQGSWQTSIATKILCRNFLSYGISYHF